MRLLWLVCLLAQRPPGDCPPAGLSPAEAQARYQEIEGRAGKWLSAGEFAKAADELRGGLCLAREPARAYHALAVAEAAAGRFDRADDALKQAIRFAPRDFRMRLTRAQVDISLGRFERARERLREAAELEPAGSGAATIHGQLAQQLVQQKQYDLALAEFLRFRREGGADPEALLTLARLENTLGAYHDAVADATALETEAALPGPVRAAAAAIAGLGAKNVDRAENAIPHFRVAMELGAADPGTVFETACLALAELYESKQDPSNARQILIQGQKIMPASTRIALALGRNLAEAGDQNAIDLLTKLIAAQPGEAESYRWLAQAYTSAGEFDRATAALEHLAVSRPDYPMIDVMIAQSLLKQREPDYPRALETLARAEKTSPADPDVFYLEGKILAQLGKYEQAVAPLRRAIKLAPASATSYYQLGLVYQKMGRPDLAKEPFDRMRVLTSADPGR